jgi:hypothetical protein
MARNSEQGKPRVLLLFLWLWWLTTSTSIHVKAETIDSFLKVGDSLGPFSSLCSKQGTYCMSFDLGPENIPTYLRIYVPQEKEDWVVWVANRNQPVQRDSVVLLLDHSGILKIEPKNGEPIILYASPQPFNNSTIVATLMDTGNFVLQDIQMKTVLWQSFDNPTDSLLPGMKLGVNHKTGEKWSLVSRLSDSVLAPGPFRLEWEPISKELVIKNREKVYWKSGELMNNNRFEYISGENFQYKIVSNNDEEYFAYTTPNKDLTIWTLLETGQLINRIGTDIARADLCNGYNTNGGCQKWGESEILPICRNSGDTFDSESGYPNYKLLHNITNASYGISDCRANCWSNCSCFGYKTFYDNGTGCVFLLSTKGLNIASNGDYLFYILVKNTDHKGMYISNYYISIMFF